MTSDAIEHCREDSRSLDLHQRTTGKTCRHPRLDSLPGHGTGYDLSAVATASRWSGRRHQHVPSKSRVGPWAQRECAPRDKPDGVRTATESGYAVPLGWEPKSYVCASNARGNFSRRVPPASRGSPSRRQRLAPRAALAQRERERERRVSDADASYNGGVCDTKTLNCAIPQ